MDECQSSLIIDGCGDIHYHQDHGNCTQSKHGYHSSDGDKFDYNVDGIQTREKRIRQEEKCSDFTAIDGAMNDHGKKVALLHPLLIEHVAKKIFSFFDWSYSNSNIISFRQVCKTWCNIITDGMRRKRKVRKLRFKHGCNSLCDDNLQKFLLDMKDTTNLPFDSFEFDVHFFTKRNTDAFNEFITTFSPCVSYLSLTFGKHYLMDLLGSLEHTLVAFDNLKHLAFKCTHLFTMPEVLDTKRSTITWQLRHPRELSQGLLTLFKKIICSAKQLEEIDLYLPSHYLEGDDGETANFLFGSVISQNLPKSVINMKLTLRLNGDHLAALGRNLKLRKLQLHFYGSDMDEKSMNDFLSSQSATLLNLQLVDFEDKFSSIAGQAYWPVCGNVSELTIKGRQLNILKSFPRLEKLVLLTEPNINVSKDHESTVCPTIHELELQYPAESLGYIANIPLYFPSIKTLKIQATPESVKAIEAIFRHLDGTLVELSIKFLESFSKQPVDGIFTGMPLSECYIIGENGMYSSDDQRRILSQIRRRPCLENLKKLKKLTVDMESVSIILTDVTVHYAFFRCPTLQEIVFHGNHCITATCFQSLKARFRITQSHSISEENQTGHTESMENNWALVPILQ